MFINCYSLVLEQPLYVFNLQLSRVYQLLHVSDINALSNDDEGHVHLTYVFVVRLSTSSSKLVFYSGQRHGHTWTKSNENFDATRDIYEGD